MALPFLDTNILLRHLLQDLPEQSPRCTAYLARVERGELKVRTADTVVFEAVFTLQRAYKKPKAEIANSIGSTMSSALNPNPTTFPPLAGDRIKLDSWFPTTSS